MIWIGRGRPEERVALGWNEEPEAGDEPRFDEPGTARAFLGSAALDAHEIRAIRALLAEELSAAAVSRMRDVEVLERAAAVLAAGRLRVGEKHEPIEARSLRRAAPKVEEPPPASSASENELTWIEFELLDEKGSRMPGQRYEIELADGSKRSGVTDSAGAARLTEIKRGVCKVKFTDLKKS
jgi:hypothetical protein